MLKLKMLVFVEGKYRLCTYWARQFKSVNGGPCGLNLELLVGVLAGLLSLSGRSRLPMPFRLKNALDLPQKC
jgi:hypothetical protein